jgi:hypothetical protein
MTGASKSQMETRKSINRFQNNRTEDCVQKPSGLSVDCAQSNGRQRVDQEALYYQSICEKIPGARDGGEWS